MEETKMLNTHSNLEKVEQGWRYHAAWFSNFTKEAAVIKMVWCQHKKRHMDPWKRVSSPEINQCLHGQLTQTKGVKIYNGVKTLYSINGVGKAGQICMKNKTKPSSYTIYKNKLQMD